MASNLSEPHPDVPVPTRHPDVVFGNEQIPAGIVGANCSQSTFPVPAEWPGRKDSVVAEMYVEHLAPETVEHEEPIILIHGDFHSGDIWLTKPDFGTGWAAYFVNRGYRVYIVHLPGSGLSSLPIADVMPGQLLPTAQYVSPRSIQNQLTAPERNLIRGATAWPTAGLHDKWPGTGQPGDPFFHRYHCTLQALLVQKPLREKLAQNGLRNLLTITGKAILIGQGAGCTAAWLAADAVPHLVSKVVAIEPAGPPGARAHTSYREGRVYSPWLSRDDNVRKFGLADIPLTFEPQVTGPALEFEARQLPDNNGCYMVQKWRPGGVALPKPLKAGQESVPQLVQLKKMRHAIVTAEASSHSMFDWATVLFMRQAGVTVDHIDLAKFGIRGNGHLMFLETNSDDIAGIVANWIEDFDEEPVARSQTASLDQDQAATLVVDALDGNQSQSAPHGNGDKRGCQELNSDDAMPPLKRQNIGLQNSMAEQAQAFDTGLQTPVIEVSQARQLTDPGYTGLQSPVAECSLAVASIGQQSFVPGSSQTQKSSDLGQTIYQYHVVDPPLTANTALRSSMVESVQIGGQSLGMTASSIEKGNQPRVLLQPDASYPSPKMDITEDSAPLKKTSTALEPGPVNEPIPLSEPTLSNEPAPVTESAPFNEHASVTESAPTNDSAPAVESANDFEYAPLTEYDSFADFLSNLAPGEESFFPNMGHLSDQVTMDDYQLPLETLAAEDPWKNLDDMEFLNMFQ